MAKEERQSTCKTLVTATNSPRAAPSSDSSPYVFSVTIPQQKVKIKVAEVLVKAMRRSKKKGSYYAHANAVDEIDKNKSRISSNKKKTRGRTTNWDATRMRIKRVGSVFSNVLFRSSRTRKSSSPPQNQRSSFKNVVGGATGENSLQIVVSDSCSFKEILKIEDRKGNNNKKKNMELVVKDQKPPSLNPSASISRFFSRRTKSASEYYGVKGEEERRCLIDEHELCKKRILMGRKCRPLNASGVLRYAGNGVILPELE